MIPMWEIEELADRAGRDDPEVTSAVEDAVCFPETRPMVKELLMVLIRRKGRLVGAEETYSIPEGLPQDGLRVGRIVSGGEVTDVERLIRTATLCQHLLVSGQTGAGKTMLTIHICRQLMDLGASVFVLDATGDYLGLIRERPIEDLLVFDAREMPINPYELPSERTRALDWIDQVSLILREAHFLRDGSEGLHTAQVRAEYAARGVFDGSGDFPTYGDVFRSVVERKYSAREQRHSGWAETLRHRMAGLLGQLGGGLCVERSVSARDLMQHSVIFDVRGLVGTALDFFVGLLMAWVRAYLQAHPEEWATDGPPRVTIVIEEAHRLYTGAKEKRRDLTEGELVQATRMVRGLSMGLVLTEQAPGATTPQQILANIGAVVTQRLTNARCINALGETRGLSRSQAAELAKLPRRRAVVQCVDVPEPCMVEIPFIGPPQRPPEEEVEARKAASLERVGCATAWDRVYELLGLAREHQTARGRADNEISGDTHRVLVHIARYVDLIEERCAALDMHRNTEHRERRRLVKLGMIQKAGMVGAKWVLYEPTAKGRAWAEERGFRVHTYKSGAVHEFMGRRVREAAGSSSHRVVFVASGEALGVGGVQPDLIAGVKDEHGDASRVVVFQIVSENKPKYEAERAKDLLGIEQVDLVVLVAKNKGTRDRLTRALQRALGSDVVAGQGQLDTAPSALRVLDFETAISEDFDWSWLLG